MSQTVNLCSINLSEKSYDVLVKSQNPDEIHMLCWQMKTNTVQLRQLHLYFCFHLIQMNWLSLSLEFNNSEDLNQESQQHRSSLDGRSCMSAASAHVHSGCSSTCQRLQLQELHGAQERTGLQLLQSERGEYDGHHRRPAVECRQPQH